MLDIKSEFKVEKLIGEDVTFVNPFSYLILDSINPSIAKSFYIFADGILLVWLHNLLNRKKIKRYSFDFTSIAHNVFNYANAQGKSIYLIGGKSGTTEEAKKILLSKYKDLKIIGCENGYLQQEETKKRVISEASKADFVISGMGTPYQELFLYELRKIYWQGSGYTCGGFFDQIIQKRTINYYPKWIDQMNLRAFYRMFKEPRRLWRRYLIVYPKFIIYFFIKNL